MCSKKHITMCSKEHITMCSKEHISMCSKEHIPSQSRLNVASATILITMLSLFHEAQRNLAASVCELCVTVLHCRLGAQLPRHRTDHWWNWPCNTYIMAQQIRREVKCFNIVCRMTPIHNVMLSWSQRSQFYINKLKHRPPRKKLLHISAVALHHCDCRCTDTMA